MKWLLIYLNDEMDFLHFFINSKKDFHIDTERMKMRRQKMSRNIFVYVKIVSLRHFMHVN